MTYFFQDYLAWSDCDEKTWILYLLMNDFNQKFSLAALRWNKELRLVKDSHAIW